MFKKFFLLLAIVFFFSLFFYFFSDYQNINSAFQEAKKEYLLNSERKKEDIKEKENEKGEEKDKIKKIFNEFILEIGYIYEKVLFVLFLLIIVGIIFYYF